MWAEICGLNPNESIGIGERSPPNTKFSWTFFFTFLYCYGFDDNLFAYVVFFCLSNFWSLWVHFIYHYHRKGLMCRLWFVILIYFWSFSVNRFYSLFLLFWLRVELISVGFILWFWVLQFICCRQWFVVCN